MSTRVIATCPAPIRIKSFVTRLANTSRAPATRTGSKATGRFSSAALKGTYISVEPFHLGRYVDEQTFRFNERKGTDGDRFATALKGITGRKLTYRELTKNGAIASAA